MDVPMRAAYATAISALLQALLFGRSGPPHLWPLLQQFLRRLVVIDGTRLPVSRAGYARLQALLDERK